MTRPGNSYLLAALLLLILGGALGTRLDWKLADKDTTEQLKKLEEAFLIINKRYVEEVEPADLVEEAIEAMLGALDPHSSYIDAAAFVEVEEGYRGSFGGIGIWFEVPDGDTARVVSPIEGGPSERVGLRAGDRIIAVDDTSAIGMNDQEIKRRLKGPIGTTVDVTLKRLGVDQPIRVTITRGQIPLYSVNSSYMVDDRTGYIKVSRFAQTTYAEFREGLAQLAANGMERLILDLRQNPGGIMETAVLMVDELLEDERTIVYTQGRVSQDDKLFRSSRPGLLEDEPIIVLVDYNSVSASEIVAGALQDHDRALIVGQPTFGKGLVQGQFTLPDDSRLQMTTARYYTPSGRLIQTPYRDGDRRAYLEEKTAALREATNNPSAYLESFPDSLRFTTTHGRTVLGGGGIMPDVVIAPDTAMAPIVRAVFIGALFEPFRLWFAMREQDLRETWSDRREDFFQHYTVSTAAWDDFWEIASGAEPRLTLTSNPDEASLENLIFTTTDLETNRETVQLHLKALLARQLYGSRAAYPLFHRIDPVFQQALTLWDSVERLPGVSQSTGSVR